MNEFQLIKTFFDWADSPEENIVKSIGDDCSIVQVPAGFELVQSIDTQVADVHFPAQAPADLIALRALRCALSDLAAMGAKTQGFHLALSIPKEFQHISFQQWLKDFSKGLKACAQTFNIPLIGGDTTSSTIPVITIQVQGLVPAGKALRRDGAQISDDIWLSGPTGLAAAALEQVLKNPADSSGLAQVYYYPQPQIELGQKLIGLANSALDVSDGLLQDAAHIAKASGLTLDIDSTTIPIQALLNAGISQDDSSRHALTGGDDYQLLFTAPSSHFSQIAELNSLPGAQLVKIGRTKAKEDHAVLLDSKPIDSAPADLTSSGYQHF